MFEAIRKAAPPRLYVASDGPRDSREGEKEKVDAVRAYILGYIDWDCEVKTLFREKNLGCGKGIFDAITWFFEYEDFGIILEDDCLPHHDFFIFCEELGKYYQNDNSIFAISGTNIRHKESLNADYFFSMLGGNWGWATWKRAWSFSVLNINKMLILKNWKVIKHNINDKFTYYSVKKLIARSESVMNESAWDYQWLFIHLLRNGKIIVPKNNLVTNIGFGDDATHTTKTDNIFANIPVYPMRFPLTHPENIRVLKIYDKYFASLFHFSDSIIKRIIRKLREKLHV